MSEGQRLFTFIESGEPSRIRHVKGFPPDRDREVDERSTLPRARIVLIEVKPDGVFLHRLTESGEYAGDTWHQSVDEATNQAIVEYGNSLGVWRSMPDSVPDPYEFAIGKLRTGQ
jgi:hypothetical protein